jgi:hypothetical protein
MKLCDLFEKDNDFDAQNDIDHKAKEMSYPSFYDKHDYGKSTKPTRQKVLVKNTKTGKVYGARMIWQRDID